jgi:hypothetical protein
MNTKPTGGEEARRSDVTEPSVEMFMARAIDEQLEESCDLKPDAHQLALQSLGRDLLLAAENIDGAILGENRRQAYWILKRVGNLLSALPPVHQMTRYEVEERMQKRRADDEDAERGTRRLQDRAAE